MTTARRPRRTAPRKRPRQERSEATVRAILEAAAREFADEGYDAATTNRIAEAAGTSVGSLYQYFPSKDAIAVELARRFRAGRVAFLQSHLESVRDKPMGVVLREIFTSFLQADGIEPRLYRVLVEQVLRANPEELRGYEEKLEAIVAAALRRTTPPLPVKDFDLAAFILVRLALALVHSATADRPRYNTPALAEEMSRLVVAYLNAE